MKKKIAEKWVAALRSGEYRQGQGALQEDGEYCCLGVLCKITGKNKTRLKQRSGMPSDGALKFFGLSAVDAGLLADMNDVGDSFKKIAKHIEKNWEDM